MNFLKILILNSTYEPLQFCTARRGIVMVLSGRAEQIECDGYVVRSPSTSFQLPAVIRVVKRVKRSRNKIVAFSKKNILRRDNFTCQYCGRSNHPLTVDHVIPKSRGGKSNWTNVVVACKPCNLKKGNQTPAENGMRLTRTPVKPNFQFAHFCIPQGPESHLDIWRKYLPKSSFPQPSIN